MNISSFTVGPFAENTYLLTEGGEALLIDPGFVEDQEFEHVKKKLREHDIDLLAVLLTHAHVDHVLGLQRVLDDFDVPVYLSERDRYLWNNFGSQAAMFGLTSNDFDFEPEVLPVTEEWQIGDFSFDVRYTPGHAPDHVSLYSSEDGIVIAGDALFREGIGRTDLYKGDFKVLEKAIREQLYSLPDDTVVYPGHGPKTTIGHEKQANPFVKA
ncbi:MBL fold metallo-hydrolase [Fodinibius sp. Rm-B-1B1-1]|uniref:MBL fold metallo-hydrolase n=1 Tax=Fodinibius alkaliphilus TaxID=3140241 RepID=UPI003159E23A